MMTFSKNRKNTEKKKQENTSDLQTEKRKQNSKIKNKASRDFLTLAQLWIKNLFAKFTKKEKLAKSIEPKQKKKKKNRYLHFIILFACYFFVMLILSSIIVDYVFNKIQQRKEKNTVLFTKENEHNFIFEEKTKITQPFSIFYFGGKETKEKQFNIKLDQEDIIIRMNLSLAYHPDNIDLGEELHNRQLELIHHINLIIGSMTFKEINTVNKREHFLKKLLLNKFSFLLQKGKIENIYFSYFFISQTKKK